MLKVHFGSRRPTANVARAVSEGRSQKFSAALLGQTPLARILWVRSTAEAIMNDNDRASSELEKAASANRKLVQAAIEEVHPIKVIASSREILASDHSPACGGRRFAVTVRYIVDLGGGPGLKVREAKLVHALASPFLGGSCSFGDFRRRQDLHRFAASMLCMDQTIATESARTVNVYNLFRNRSDEFQVDAVKDPRWD